MTTEEDFQKKLDENHDDWQTRLVFADWLDERGDPRGPGYRALGTQQMFPRMFGTDAGFADESDVKRAGGGNENCCLPNDWYKLLCRYLRLSEPMIGGIVGMQIGGLIGKQIMWRDYRSRRAAENAAAWAFAKLPTKRRTQLLSTVVVVRSKTTPVPTPEDVT
jgi:uncharacterized protein (TIGR02996 family)